MQLTVICTPWCWWHWVILLSSSKGVDRSVLYAVLKRTVADSSAYASDALDLLLEPFPCPCSTTNDKWQILLPSFNFISLLLLSLQSKCQMFGILLLQTDAKAYLDGTWYVIMRQSSASVILLHTGSWRTYLASWSFCVSSLFWLFSEESTLPKYLLVLLPTQERNKIWTWKYD